MKQFNTWERYFDPKHPKHRYQVARHKWIIDRVVGPRLLDVGCSGGLALYLAGKKDDVTELCGVDICKDTIDLAAHRLMCYTEKRVFLRIGCAEMLTEKPGYFDTVICGETLEHVSSDFQVMNEISRVIRPGGTLIVSVPKDGHLSKEHVRLYNRKKLTSLILNNSFDIAEESEMMASRNGKYLLCRAVRV